MFQLSCEDYCSKHVACLSRFASEIARGSSTGRERHPLDCASPGEKERPKSLAENSGEIWFNRREINQTIHHWWHVCSAEGRWFAANLLQGGVGHFAATNLDMLMGQDAHHKESERDGGLLLLVLLLATGPDAVQVLFSSRWCVPMSLTILLRPYVPICPRVRSCEVLFNKRLFCAAR